MVFILCKYATQGVIEGKHCLQIWHDGSELANQGYIALCMNILYDPAVFYTDIELNETENPVPGGSIQKFVEIPEIYMVMRCPSSDDQLAYSETRIRDLLGLKFDINLIGINESYEGIYVKDILRFFHVNVPATQIHHQSQSTPYHTHSTQHFTQKPQLCSYTTPISQHY